MRAATKLLLLAAAGWAGAAGAQAGSPAPKRPTIVLVHGAFAESAGWDAVTDALIEDGYRVVAAANPLRSVDGDSGYLASLVASIPGDVVLVGHSYAGMVISQAAQGAGNVRSLVYVAAFAPEVGESAATLSGRYPGGTLGPTLARPVPLPGGGKDLYIDQGKFRVQFAADVPEPVAARMAVGQRPITEAALNQPATAAAWKTKPSWFVYGTLDKNIPSAAHAFMAKRANALETVAVEGASHVVMISHPARVAQVIEHAAGGK